MALQQRMLWLFEFVPTIVSSSQFKFLVREKADDGVLAVWSSGMILA
jgi:hypothetical protein